MNQKQRDLLCDMVRSRCKEIFEAFNAHMNARAQHIPPTANSYCSFDRHQVSENILSEMTTKERKEYESLKDKSKTIQQHVNDLNERWYAWNERCVVTLVGTIMRNRKNECEDTRERGNAAIRRALESAVLEIQFADNADEAKEILSNLPCPQDLWND